MPTSVRVRLDPIDLDAEKAQMDRQIAECRAQGEYRQNQAQLEILRAQSGWRKSPFATTHPRNMLDMVAQQGAAGHLHIIRNKAELTRTCLQVALPLFR